MYLLVYFISSISNLLLSIYDIYIIYTALYKGSPPRSYKSRAWSCYFEWVWLGWKLPFVSHSSNCARLPTWVLYVYIATSCTVVRFCMNFEKPHQSGTIWPTKKVSLEIYELRRYDYPVDSPRFVMLLAGLVCLQTFTWPVLQVKVSVR